MAQLDLSKFKSNEPALDLSKFDTKSKEENIDLSIPPDITDEIPVEQKEPAKKGWLGRAWDAVSKPITEAPSRFAHSIADYIDDPRGEGGYWKGLAAGSIQGLGDVTSNLTSPINLALTAAGLGEMGAAKAGLPEFANLAHMATKALSVPFAGHGAYETLRPDASLAERGMGLAELAGGLVGMKAGPHEVNAPLKRGPEFTDPAGLEWVNEELAKLKEGKYNQGERPAGPWETNTGDRPAPLGLTDDKIFELARQKHNMGQELPIDEIRNSGPVKDLMDQYLESNPEGPVKAGLPWKDESGNVVGYTTDNNGSTGLKFLNEAEKGKSFDDMLSSFGGSGHPESPEYVSRVLGQVESGKPGFSVEEGKSDIPALQGQQYQNLVYRNSKGEPIGVAKIVTDSQGKQMVQDLAVDKSKGLLSGRAAKAIGDKLKEMGVSEPAGTISPDAMNFKEKMSRGVAEEFDPSTLNFEDTLKKTLDQRMKETTGQEEPKLDLEKFGAKEPVSEIADTARKQASEFGPQTQTGTQPPKPPNKNPIIGHDELDPNIPVSYREGSNYKASTAQEIYNLPRGLMSIDLPFMTSAAMRQASPLAMTKDWFKAWGTAAKAYGSENAYKAMQNEIMNSKYFQPKFQQIFDKKGNVVRYKELPSFAETAGVKLTDLSGLSQREEQIASTWAEKLPFYGKAVRASNRSYAAFLNDLRKNQFEKLIQQATDSGLSPTPHSTIAREIADFINAATGRGKLEIGVGNKTANLEQYSKALTNTLFSPRLIASRVKFLNPSTYIQASPMARQEYFKGLARTIGTWWGIAKAAEFAGASVSKDPNNADFGKIKIGNNRIDPGAGFQQYLVLGSRMATGDFTSSTSGKQTHMGVGFKPRTRLSTAQEFAANKLHPTAKLAYDLMGASMGKPVNLSDEVVQRVLPMMVTDMVQAAKDDPEMAALVGIASSVGMGAQSYGNNNFNEPVYFGKKSPLRPFSVQVLGR